MKAELSYKLVRVQLGRGCRLVCLLLRLWCLLLLRVVDGWRGGWWPCSVRLSDVGVELGGVRCVRQSRQSSPAIAQSLALLALSLSSVSHSVSRRVRLVSQSRQSVSSVASRDRIFTPAFTLKHTCVCRDGIGHPNPHDASVILDRQLLAPAVRLRLLITKPRLLSLKSLRGLNVLVEQIQLRVKAREANAMQARAGVLQAAMRPLAQTARQLLATCAHQILRTGDGFHARVDLPLNLNGVHHVRLDARLQRLRDVGEASRRGGLVEERDAGTRQLRGSRQVFLRVQRALGRLQQLLCLRERRAARAVDLGVLALVHACMLAGMMLCSLPEGPGPRRGGSSRDFLVPAGANGRSWFRFAHVQE